MRLGTLPVDEEFYHQGMHYVVIEQCPNNRTKVSCLNGSLQNWNGVLSSDKDVKLAEPIKRQPEIGTTSRKRIGFDQKSVRPSTLPTQHKNPIATPEELFRRLSMDICVYSVMCPAYKADDLQKFLDGWFSKYRIQILK